MKVNSVSGSTSFKGIYAETTSVWRNFSAKKADISNERMQKICNQQPMKLYPMSNVLDSLVTKYQKK